MWVWLIVTYFAASQEQGSIDIDWPPGARTGDAAKKVTDSYPGPTEFCSCLAEAYQRGSVASSVLPHSASRGTVRGVPPMKMPPRCPGLVEPQSSMYSSGRGRSLGGATHSRIRCRRLSISCMTEDYALESAVKAVSMAS